MTDPVEKQRKWAGKLAQKIGLSLDEFLDELEFEDDGADEEPSEWDALYGDLKAQIDHLVEEGETHATLIPGSKPEELFAFLGEVAGLRNTLETGDFDALQAIIPNVNALPHRLREIRSAVDARLVSEAEALERELLEATPPAGFEADDSPGFDTARQAALVLVRARPVDVDCFTKARELLRLAAEAITQKVKEREAQNRRLTLEAAEIYPVGILDSQKKRFKSAMDLIDASLAPPITSAKNSDAAKQIKAAEALRKTFDDEVKAIGGEEKARDINDAFGDRFGAIETALGGTAAVVELLNHYSPHELADLIVALGDGKAGAENLKETFVAFGSGANAKKAIQELGAENLKKMQIDGSTLDEIAGMNKGLGPATLKVMFTEHDNLTAAQEVLKGFGTDASLLRDLVNDSGLANEPKALVALLTPSADNSPSDIAEMVKKFDNKEKRERLGGMIGEGGLGEHPEVFGELVKTAGGDGLVAMATAFDSKSKREALKKGLNEGGLAQPGVKPKFLGEFFNNCSTGSNTDKGNAMVGLLTGLTPDSRGQMKNMMKDGGVGQAPKAFAVMMRDGCGNDPAALKALLDKTNSDSGRTGMKALLANAGMDGSVAGAENCMAEMLQASGGDPDSRATGFANLIKGIDGTMADNFKTMLDKGGLAGHPKVLAPLIAKGCGNDARKLGLLAENISGNATAQDNLAGLVNKGGFGAKVSGGADTNTKPECFAELFETGCGGSPAELVNLLNVMGDTQQAQMCTLMKDGDLGKHPKVLANMYKHGCLSKGEADATGRKDPAKLLVVLADFAGSGPLFKEMMTTGGFGTGPEERLGSVMRYGFTNKGTKDADLTQLKAMATAFSGADMVKLDTMLKAMEGADPMALPTDRDKALQPGGGLQNILAWDGHAGSAAKLKTKFYDKLAAPSPTSPARQSSNLSLSVLIQTAASFEGEPIATPQSSFVTATGQQIDMRADHILGRHTRKYQDFGDVKAQNTLFPAHLDAAGIDALAKASVANITPTTDRRKKRREGFPPTATIPNRNDRKRRPPIDIFDLNSARSSWPKDSVSTGDGYSVKVTFIPSNQGGDRVMLDQFYPDESGTDPHVLDVNQADMRKIRSALRNQF
ncbi:hypothetical protein OS190_11260 [Sulfitobacter sp. F26204]|uniref:hypothetical protein n=1 Tax=Sulfitobacter sp. F26204 TaxID=2996014 RepID=UPI00225E289D|nr:hypothetical protein [Sulfitobacter sp. F26204]MCX7560147.1 hypothetical protein [Sulfitobacter sp. F26204]